MSFKYSLCELCTQRQGDGVQFGRATGRTCFICRGLTSKVDPIRRKVLRALDRQQFETFSIGTIVPPEIQEREDGLRSELRIRGEETIKSQLSKIIALSVKAETGKTLDRSRPELTVLVDAGRSRIQMQARPVFVRGRYSKPRGIPQRMYFCESCNGRGCAVCSGSGYIQTPSVESVIGSKLSSLTGSSRARFTWLGSEDADSQVLPPGRPFVVELRGPKRRKVPSRLNLRTGKGLLRLSALHVLADRPAEPPSFVIKTRIFIDCPGELPDGMLRRMRRDLSGVSVRFESSKGRTVYKKIHSIRTRAVGKNLISDVRMDGGLPVKRFVSGEGVSPSISESLKTPLKCVRFDIIRIWTDRSW